MVDAMAAAPKETARGMWEGFLLTSGVKAPHFEQLTEEQQSRIVEAAIAATGALGKVRAALDAVVADYEPKGG